MIGKLRSGIIGRWRNLFEGLCREKESGKTNGQRGTHLTVFSVGETVWLCCRYTTLRYPQKFIGGSDEDPFECDVQYVDKAFGYDFVTQRDSNLFIIEILIK